MRVMPVDLQRLTRKLSIPSPAMTQHDLATVTDTELITAINDGQHEAFAQLTQRYLERILAIAQRILNNSADADEVTQETFLRFWECAHAWDVVGKASIRTWLTRVVTNLCIDRIRRRRWRPAPLEEAMEIHDRQPDAFEITGDNKRRQMVQDLLAQLPVNQRIAVVLSYFEEMRGSEIAAAMHLSDGAVESLLVRARKSLRKRLDSLGVKLEEYSS